VGFSIGDTEQLTSALPRVYWKATGGALLFRSSAVMLSLSFFPSCQERNEPNEPLRNILRSGYTPAVITRRLFDNNTTMADAASTRSSSSSSISSSASASSSSSTHSYSSPTRTPLGRVDSSTHVFPAKPPKPSLSKRSDGAKDASSDGLRGFPATRCKKTNQLFNGLDWVLEAITEPKSK
jgi:hypothetical protein